MDDKLILVIDEFQYLGKSNPAFPSMFQKIWDTLLKDQNIMVILCGSLIPMMESQTLSYTSPLYGRRTGQIKLKQIPFAYYHEFYPTKPRKDLIEYYAVTGGVPKYIEHFYESADIYSAIDKNILSKQSFLYDEPNFLLQREVTSKRGLYKIKDNFILFWFKFIYPNLSFIESGNTELALKKIEANLADSHISFVYEDICIEEMWKLNAAGKWAFTFDRIGRWWNNEMEIDIVAFDSTGTNIIFGECKYWQGKVGINVLKQLEEKAKTVEWKQQQRNEHFVLFSIHGFTDELVAFAKTRSDVLLCQ